VFIVNDSTFPSHLQYQFAGTGSQDKDENVELLADISRVRPSDLVLFYIEATTKIKGGFYGVFKVAEQTPLVFNVSGQDGVRPNLGKKLIYRTLFESQEVYSQGVPEWEALDKLPVYATELQWSLIYRKLKAKRGCTPLLPWESQRLIDMIRNKNSAKPIATSQYAGGFDWDIANRVIVTTNTRQPYPYPRAYSFDTISSIWDKKARKRAYEDLLQLYLTENIKIVPQLDAIVGNNLIWFGNEVASGVGMQKIDILSICQENDKNIYRIIELKDEAVSPSIVDQLEYYINWASHDNGRHLEGAYNWNIQPVIIAPPHDSHTWQSVTDAFCNFNQRSIALPIIYFEFSLPSQTSISFSQVSY